MDLHIVSSILLVADLGEEKLNFFLYPSKYSGWGPVN